MRPADYAQRRALASDEGVATVLSAVLSLTLLFVAWVGYQVGAVVLTRHRVEGAADLAALAAASHVVQGQDFACERAGWVAREMRVRLTDCRVDGRDARVFTAAELSGVPLRSAEILAHARAGPAGGAPERAPPTVG